MARVIGIDYGTKRIGIAVTDPLQLIATPLQTVQTPSILPFLQKYLQQHQVEALVVGRPLSLSTNSNKITWQVDRFVAKLKKYFPNLPIFTFDERFTSVMAQASCVEGHFKKTIRQDKARLDVVSATFILRSFLTYYHTTHLHAT